MQYAVKHIAEGSGGEADTDQLKETVPLLSQDRQPAVNKADREDDGGSKNNKDPLPVIENAKCSASVFQVFQAEYAGDNFGSCSPAQECAG